MTKNYRIQWMNKAQYNRFMGGELFYNFQTEYITAKNEEEAKATVQKNNPTCFYINPYIITREQEEAEKVAHENARKVEEEKKAAAKARKEARDMAKGITPEKRKAINNLKKHEGNARYLERQIEELKKELAEELAIIEKKRNALEGM